MGCCQSDSADANFPMLGCGREKTLDDVKPDIDKAMRYLKKCDSYTTDEASNFINVLLNLASISSSLRKESAIYLAQLGYGQMYVKMTKSLYDYRQALESNSKGVHNLMLIQMAFWNFTDVCPELGRDLGQHGGVDMLLKDLAVLDQYQGTSLVTEYIEVLLGILHNSIHLYSANRPIYRKANAISILTKLLNSNDMTIKLKTLLVLAYCVDEEESGILATAHGCVAFLTNMLTKAVKSPDHRANSGNSRFSAKELLSGLNHLAINDDNKCEIENQNGIVTIGRMLQPDFSEEEQYLAVKGLWNLSFIKSIRQNTQVTECLPVLETLSESQNDDLREASTFALWEIKEFKMDSKVGSTERPTQMVVPFQQKTSDDGSNQGRSTVKHVMISYQWDYQQCALCIKENLIAAGYTVWMDIDKMKGNILTAMAEAVEQSAVLVVCMSQKYKESLNCRSEASYAYKKEKHIVPILVEDGYIPDGWLGILLGMNLYYEAFSDELLRKNTPAIISEIGEKGYGNTDRGIDTVDSPLVVQQESTVQKKQATSLQAAIVPQSNTAGAEIQQHVRMWTKDRVQEWFVENDLQELSSVLHFCDGKHLLTMYNRHNISSEAFQTDLKTDLGLDFNTRLKFTTALDELFTCE